MFYLAGGYVTAMIALLIGLLLTFVMACYVLTSAAVLFTVGLSVAVMLIISEFRNIARRPDEHNPFTKKERAHPDEKD